MFFTARIEIDGNGLMKQMERVEKAQRNLEEEMDKLREMLWQAKIKEKRSSEEPPEVK